MTVINGSAQRAFRVMLNHYFDTGRWDAGLIEAWHKAEDAENEMAEWRLDAAHEAVMAEMAELSDAERDRIPDVPLASWTRIDEIPDALASYWNRGA